MVHLIFMSLFKDNQLMALALGIWTGFIVLAFFYIVANLEGENIMGAPIVLLAALIAAGVPWVLCALFTGISLLS